MILLHFQTSKASSRECIKSGNWSDASTWLNQIIPGSNDDVLIHESVIIALDRDVKCHALKVIIGATINNMGHNLEITGDFYLDGLITGKGTISLSGKDVTMDGHGKVINLDEVTISGNKTILATANILFNGSTILHVTGGLIINNGKIECQELSIYNMSSTETKFTVLNGILIVNEQLNIYSTEGGGESTLELLQKSSMIVKGDVKIIGDTKPARIDIKNDSELKILGDIRLAKINGQIAELKGYHNASIFIEGDYYFGSTY